MGRYSDDVEERQAAATALRDLDVPLSAWREQLASKEG